MVYLGSWLVGYFYANGQVSTPVWPSVRNHTLLGGTGGYWGAEVRCFFYANGQGLKVWKCTANKVPRGTVAQGGILFRSATRATQPHMETTASIMRTQETQQPTTKQPTQQPTTKQPTQQEPTTKQPKTEQLTTNCHKGKEQQCQKNAVKAMAKKYL